MNREERRRREREASKRSIYKYTEQQLNERVSAAIGDNNIRNFYKSAELFFMVYIGLTADVLEKDTYLSIEKSKSLISSIYEHLEMVIAPNADSEIMKAYIAKAGEWLDVPEGKEKKEKAAQK